MRSQEQDLNNSSPTEYIRPQIENTLATRYASDQMLDIWDPKNKVIFERDLWIAVMKAQASMGLDIPQVAIDAYEGVRDVVDMNSMRDREIKTKHDVKARIEEFNSLAGYEYSHLGLTSRDLTDCVEQMQIKRSMELIRDKSIASIGRFGKLALENEAIVMAARSHNVPAQPTLLGKRFASLGEEALYAHNRVQSTIDAYPLRGIKGPVGTQTDQLQLLKDPQKVEDLEKSIAEHLGFKNVMGSVGQVYPRSFDFDVISALYQVSAAPSNLALMVRLMAGQEQMNEGFSDGQSGSSAMPHKMNTRTCERINALHDVLSGYVTMTASIAGKQWNEGDVSDSAVRRVALSDAFFATDGLLEALLHVQDEAGVYDAVIKKELGRYMPFLTSTRVLMAATEHGVGREQAHKVIKKHSTGVVKQMQQGNSENTLFDLLAEDQDLGLTREEIAQAVDVPQEELVGNAHKQILDFSKKVEALTNQYPDAANYNPQPLL